MTREPNPRLLADNPNLMTATTERTHPMNTEHQPQQHPTRDPACCGTCAAIVSALTPAIVSALTPEQPVKAPVEGQDSQRPSEPVLPRRIDPEDVRQWWLIEDAPVDPDAELVERMARAIDAEPGFNVSDMAYAALRALREIRDVTPRAEQ